MGKTISDAFRYGCGVLSHTPTAELDCQVLLQFILGLTATEFFVRMPQPMTQTDFHRYCNLLAKRAADMPIAYITGKKEFMSLDFDVSPDCLIPRPETEILTQCVIDRADSAQTVLDIGTGSGCIAVSLAYYLPKISVTAVDISAAALQVARINAQKHHVNINFLCGDLYSVVAGKKFDIIVSNPPYIGEKEELPKSVRDYEPPQALFSKKGGLELIEKILAGFDEYVNPGGFIALEIGSAQAERVMALCRSYQLNCLQLIKDLAGLARVVIAARQ